MQQQHVVITKGVGTSINPGGTESAAQTTWMNDGFIVNDPILEEPITISPLRREADSLTEQKKLLSEPSSIPGLCRRLSFDGLVIKYT